MDNPQLLEKVTPLVTALFGGIGIKVIEKILSKRSEEFSDSAKIREELRGQINELRKELDEWKEEADEWRKKYWEQVEINIKQKSRYEDDMRQLTTDMDALKFHVGINNLHRSGSTHS
jgi:DNA-binding transcriptional MerR regulator